MPPVSSVLPSVTHCGLCKEYGSKDQMDSILEKLVFYCVIYEMTLQHETKIEL